MENPSNADFDSKAKMTDLLSSQKYITSNYNTYLCETSTATVKNCLSGILNEEHRIQQEIFDEMSSRGWYQTDKAEDTKLNSVKQKYSQQANI